MISHPGMTAVFIDGSNLYSTTKALNNIGVDRDVDYRKLLTYFKQRGPLIRMHYYSAVLETEEYSPLKPLTDWLAYNGYTVVMKAAKEFTDAAGRRRIKGNMDIEIATDMLLLATTGRVSEIILFSGDSDFRYMVEAVQRLGVKVTVVSSLKTSPPMIGDDLRRQADEFVELSEIISNFTRDPRERN